MIFIVSGVIGVVAAIAILYLISRDHLRVRYGLWWIAVAIGFMFMGFFPQWFDALAAKVGIASGPVLALTIAVSLLIVKVLTQDIARSNNETRIIRLVQRVAMLEAELRQERSGSETPPSPGGTSEE